MRTKWYWGYPVGSPEYEYLSKALQELSGHWLFSDGGILGANNKVSQGTVSAFVHVYDGSVIGEYAGTLLDHESKTSNHAEVWAAFTACQHMVRQNLEFSLVLDSGVTWQRIQNCRMEAPQSWEGESRDHVLQLYEPTFRTALLKRVVLVSGHPKPKILNAIPETTLCAQYPGKDRFWHRYNVLADDLCNQEKALQTLGDPSRVPCETT